MIILLRREFDDSIHPGEWNIEHNGEPLHLASRIAQTLSRTDLIVDIKDDKIELTFTGAVSSEEEQLIVVALAVQKSIVDYPPIEEPLP